VSWNANSALPVDGVPSARADSSTGESKLSVGC
jgi:hypothetical protein